MAIYHFSVKTISRSDGRSAVAVLLIAAEKLTCDYYGKEQDYTKIRCRTYKYMHPKIPKKSY
jgi:hypothetical protein